MGANEGMSIGFLLIYRNQSEFLEVTPLFYFLFHAEQRIRLNVLTLVCLAQKKTLQS